MHQRSGLALPCFTARGTTNSQHFQDADSKTVQLQPDTKRSVGHHLRLEEIFPISIGRKFILVTDHQLLVAMFGLNKPTPALTANRLSRWALFLKFNYTIEYRKTSERSRADVLSRPPVGEEPFLDRQKHRRRGHRLYHCNTESASGTNRLGYVAERVFSRSNFDEGHAIHERSLVREKRRLPSREILQNRRLTQCLSWLFTVWSPGANSEQATSSSARSFARMPFRHAAGEAAGKDSSLLAEHRFRHSLSMPAMFD